MSESWKTSPCACVHSDPRECARIRDNKTAEILGQPYNDWNMKRFCECVCHDEYQDDWDDDWVNPSKRTPTPPQPEKEDVK